MVAAPIPDTPEFRRMFIQAVDQQIRGAIQACWSALPDERRNVEEVEKEIRRVVDRAFRDFRDDAGSFGLPSS